MTYRIRRLAGPLALTLLPFAAVAQDGLAQGEDEDDVGYIARLLQDNLSGAGRDVRIRGFAGALSSQATIELLTIADGEGIWLEAENLELDWNRAALLRRQVEVEALTAGRISILRAPIADPDLDLPEPEASLFSLPELPVSIQIDEVSAARIELGDFLIGEPVAIALDGEVSLADGEGFANITAERIDGGVGSFVIDGAYSNATRNLDLSLTLEEGTGGLAANALGLPGEPSVSLQVTGNAPIDDFAADLTLATDGVPRITGDFTLATTRAPAAEDGTIQPAARDIALDVSGDVTALILPEFQPFFGDQVSLVAEVMQSADGALEVEQFSLAAQAVQIDGSLALDPQGWPLRFALDGNLGSDAGQLRLPAGTDVFVDAGEIYVAFDSAESDEWSGFAFLNGLEQPGLSLPSVSLFGDGVITRENGIGTANIRFNASDIEVADSGLADALGPDVSGSAAVTFAGGGPTRIEDLELNGAGLTAGGDIAIATEGALSVTLDLAADADDFARFSGIAGRQLAGSGRVELAGDLRPLDGIFDIDLTADGTGLAIGEPRIDPLLGDGRVEVSAARSLDGTRVDRLLIATEQVQATGSADLTSTVANVRLDATLADLGLLAPELSGPGTLTARADRDAAEVTVFSANLDSETARLDLSGTAQSEADDYDTALTLAADVTALAPFADLIGIDIAGAATLDVEGTVGPVTRDFDLRIAGTTRDLALGIAQLDPLIAGAGRIAIDARKTGERYTLRDFAISTPQITATGSGQRGPDATSGQIDARLAEVGLVLDDLSGPATLTGTAEQDASGDIALDIDLGVADASMQFDGTVGAPDAGYQTAGTLIARIPNLAPFGALARRDLGGAINLNAQGSVDPEAQDFDIQLSAATQDLALGIDLLDPLLAGAGRLRLDAAKVGERIDLTTLDLTTDEIRATGTGTLSPEARAAEIDARIDDLGLILPGLSGPGTLAGTANEIAGGSVVLDLTATAPGARADLDATVAPPDQDYRATGALSAQIGDLSPFAPLVGQPIRGSVTLDADGTVAPLTGGFDIDLSARTADLGIGIAQLDQLLRGPGAVDASVSRSDAGDIRVEALDLALPNLTVTGGVTTGADGTAAEFNARLANIGLFVPDLSGPVTARGTARQEGANWRLDTEVSGAGGVDATVSGIVGQATDLAITGTAPLGLANPFLTPRRLSGDARFNLALQSLGLSGLSGTVDISGGRFTAPTFRQALERINGTVQLGGGVARADLTGAVPAGGSVRAFGPIGLSAPFQSNVDVQLRNVVARDPQLYETTINGEILLAGPLSGGARISGTIDVGRTEIKVPSSSVGALGPLPEVRHIATPSGVAQTLNRAGLTTAGTDIGASGGGGGGSAGGFPLDILIRAPDQIFVRGRGLDAELGGSLQIAGTTNDVRPVGAFELIRGRIDVLQQGFQLTEGRAQLEGDFVPYLTLRAETESPDGIAISIIAEGPADDPEIRFESAPQLPQDEVLARLLFGRDISQITPLQAVRLASAVNTLSGRGGGGFLGNVREGLGVDNLDILTDEAGNTAVQVGTYLGENLYTDVTVNSVGDTQIDLNLDVTRSLTARGSVDSSGEASLGIFFERDY